MTSNPWHLRLPTTKHYQWYQNLVDRHRLTESWLKEIQSERPSHLLTRGLRPEIQNSLWFLESLPQIELTEITDDTSVEQQLSRLEHTIWSAQAWTLNALMTRTPSINQEALHTLLEQISWKMGKASFESRWKLFKNKNDSDLRKIISFLKDSPLSGYPKKNGFLIQRAISTEVQIQLHYCPHQIRHIETKPIADRLCQLHSHWMRGFIYEINSQASVELSIQAPRCTQRWFFI